ncbi:MAG: PEP-CTERM sorting domain-containing protein [Planctomycetes bacterium]|nr:PEP-CTERM sorting domain-containing protein [Planctomycetota bacterium]
MPTVSFGVKHYIVGYGIHSGFGGEAWVVHIPEPASSILILTVFLVYGLRKPHRTDFN